MMEEDDTVAVIPVIERLNHPKPAFFIPTGHVAFHLLCHASRIGALIGKAGSVIRQLQQLTNSRIWIQDPPEPSRNRVISIVASPNITKSIRIRAFAPSNCREMDNGVWVNVSAAQEVVVRVFERVVEAGAAGGIGGVVPCRLLVCREQGGAVIGRGGEMVEKIKKDTGCSIKVWAVAPSSTDETEMVEIIGAAMAAKKALLALTERLQQFPPPPDSATIPTLPLEFY